jgi:hypothetical protein
MKYHAMVVRCTTSTYSAVDIVSYSSDACALGFCASAEHQRVKLIIFTKRYLLCRALSLLVS